MSEIFETLGLDTALLVSQIVNFLLLLILLKKFAYGPILKMLESREEKIRKSLKNAEKIQLELSEAETTKAREIARAKEEARKIIEAAYVTAQNANEKTMQETQTKTREIVEKAKEEIRAEKDKSLREAEGQIADLALIIAEKILKRNLDANAEQRLTEETLTKLN